MATAVTTDTLRALAGFRAETGCAVSLYLDLSPSSTPTIPDVETKFNSLLSKAQKLADRNGVKVDLERIREWWDAEFDHDGARGLAIFASSADAFFEVLPLTEGRGDSAHVGPSLHITPLVTLLGRDGDLVAVVGRERGTIYRVEGGRLREVADESEEQPGQHDQGGWSQARYQRHIEHLVQQHLKTVGEAIDERRRGRRPHIVVIGPEEVRGELASALSTEARSSIVGWTTAEAHAGPAELLAAARPFLDEARARADEEALARFEELHGRGERTATGWKQVLEAASDARVGVLLVEESAHAQAWECPECGRASADGGSCPLDGTKLEQRDDAVDLAVHRTLAGGGSIVRVGGGALGEARGIGALLRY